MEEIDIKQMFKNVWQRKNILIYILLVSIFIGMIYTFIIKKPTYEVTAQILIDRADTSIGDFVISKDILNTDQMQVKFDKTSKLISITTTMNEQEETFKVTNQYIQKLQTKLQETYGIKTFKIINTPQLPEEPNNINYGKDIFMFVIIGLVAYGIYIMILFNFSGISSCIEIENATSINVLGEVALEKSKNRKQTILYDTKNKKIIDELKRIEANIQFNKENKNPKVILLTGTDKKVGNSYIANNLASQYAKVYEKVLLIDTDIISKTLTKYYGKKEKEGLTNVLEKSRITEIEKVIQETQKDNLYFIPVGNNKVEEEIFMQDNINNIIENLKEKFDIIIIDGLSINEYVAPICLANIADTTVITMQTGKTKIESILKAKSTIENVGGRITGIIMNKKL